jgi:hypothetical protein
MIVPRAPKTRPCSTNALALICALAACITAAPPARGADDAARPHDAARLPDTPPLPILAWAGPPEQETTAERYKELAEAGFTHNYTGFGSVAAMAKALDVAHAAGIKLFVSTPELAADPEGTARRFKAHPAIAGYALRDEPSAADFDGLAKWVRRIQSVDAVHPCYINLYPNYCPASALGTADYPAHVARFVKEVPVQLLSFDHYPVVGESLRPEWYANLEVVSAAARESGKPFWAFALATAHGAYPLPTPAQLRVQVYSNLAYGAQGIQYFTYWTPKSDTWDFHEGPITPDGKRSAVYDRVREVNRELQTLRGVFVGSQVESIGHTGAAIPAGTRAYTPAAPVRSLQTEGTGAVVSLLANGPRRFLVVVNRDFQHEMPLRVSFDPMAKVRRVAKDGTLAALAESGHESKVPPGDAAIFVWEAK